jgi:hypothetical protein
VQIGDRRIYEFSYLFHFSFGKEVIFKQKIKGMKSYNASELLNLQINGDFPLNCQFMPKTPIPLEFESAGIYMLFFDQEIIYIGLAVKEEAVLRLRKQLSTITLRGNNVSFNDACKGIIQSSSILSRQFSQAINQNNARFETSANRIQFSEANWELFSRMNDEILSRFLIVWFPENECQEETLVEIRNRWVSDLKPICNG